MPRVAESVIVLYCDFCPKTGKEAKASSACKLCGALLCYRHAVNVEFGYDNPRPRAEQEESFLDIWYTHVCQGGGRICPECVSNATLAGVTRRLKEISVSAAPRSGGTSS